MAKSKKSSLLKKEVNVPMPKKVASSKAGKSRKLRLPRYIRESIQEIKKVTWPNRKDTWRLTFAVILFTALFTVFIIVADYGFEKIAERIFL